MCRDIKLPPENIRQKGFYPALSAVFPGKNASLTLLTFVAFCETCFYFCPYYYHIQGLKLLRKARKEGKVEIVTRKEMGRPLNMGGVFRKADSDLDEDERDEDVDEISDLANKIKYVYE